MKPLHGPITPDQQHMLNQLGYDKDVDWKAIWRDKIKAGECDCQICRDRHAEGEAPYSLPKDYMFVRQRRDKDQNWMSAPVYLKAKPL